MDAYGIIKIKELFYIYLWAYFSRHGGLVRMLYSRLYPYGRTYILFTERVVIVLSRS